MLVYVCMCLCVFVHPVAPLMTPHSRAGRWALRAGDWRRRERRARAARRRRGRGDGPRQVRPQRQWVRMRCVGGTRTRVRSDVAREAASVVLLRDDFSAAVRAPRRAAPRVSGPAERRWKPWNDSLNATRARARARPWKSCPCHAQVRAVAEGRLLMENLRKALGCGRARCSRRCGRAAPPLQRRMC